MFRFLEAYVQIDIRGLSAFDSQLRRAERQAERSSDSIQRALGGDLVSRILRDQARLEAATTRTFTTVANNANRASAASGSAFNQLINRAIAAQQRLVVENARNIRANDALNVSVERLFNTFAAAGAAGVRANVALNDSVDRLFETFQRAGAAQVRANNALDNSVERLTQTLVAAGRAALRAEQQVNASISRLLATIQEAAAERARLQTNIFAGSIDRGALSRVVTQFRTGFRVIDGAIRGSTREVQDLSEELQQLTTVLGRVAAQARRTFRIFATAVTAVVRTVARLTLALGRTALRGALSAFRAAVGAVASVLRGGINIGLGLVTRGMRLLLAPTLAAVRALRNFRLIALLLAGVLTRRLVTALQDTLISIQNIRNTFRFVFGNQAQSQIQRGF